MTRQDVEREYTVRDGTIISPGKFEGEPVWAPYFWDLGLNGWADCETEWDEFQFVPDSEDRQLWPELAKVKAITLAELDNGFVVTSTMQ